MTDPMQNRSRSRRMFCSRLVFNVFCFGVFASEELITHERNYRQRQKKRDQHGNCERNRQRGEELPHDSLQQAERQKYHDGGERRGGNWPVQLVNSFSECLL